MQEIDLNSVAAMERAALRAGRVIQSYLENPERVKFWEKPDQSLVMNIDEDAQRAALEELGTNLPALCEEDPSTHHLWQKGERCFLVDPLDGTASCKRFLRQKALQVGFGPLLGLASDRKLEAAVFLHVPQKLIFSTIKGQGVRVAPVSFADGETLSPFESRQKLAPSMEFSLAESGLLFYPGIRGELRVLEKIRRANLVENCYRFGGFANDCTRLARGFEQVQIQFAVKPWDFSAALLVKEAGYHVVCDPLKRAVDFDDWQLEENNPLISCPPAQWEAIKREISGPNIFIDEAGSSSKSDSNDG